MIKGQNMTRKQRRRNLDLEIENWVTDMARLEHTPGEIYREMESKFNDKSKLPSLRTIQRIVVDIKVKDTSAPWTISNIKVDVEKITFEDARLLLDILRVIFLITKGRKRSFTVKEAQWVLKIAKLEPRNSYFQIWEIAQEFMQCEANGIDTEELFLRVVLNDQGSLVNSKAFEFAFDKGWLADIYKNWPDFVPAFEFPLIEYLSRDPRLEPKDIAEFFGMKEENIKGAIKVLDEEYPRRRDTKEEQNSNIRGETT